MSGRDTPMDDTPLTHLQPIVAAHGPGISTATDEPVTPEASSSHHLQAMPETSTASAVPPDQQDMLSQQHCEVVGQRSKTNGEPECAASQGLISEMADSDEDGDSQDSAFLWRRINEVREQLNELQDQFLMDHQWKRVMKDHFSTINCRASPASRSDRGYDFWMADDNSWILNQPEGEANQLAEDNDTPADSLFESTAKVASSTATNGGATQDQESKSTGLRGRKLCRCGGSAPCNLNHQDPEMNACASSSKATAPPMTEITPPQVPSLTLPPIGSPRESFYGAEQKDENACFLANSMGCYDEEHCEEDPHRHADDTDRSMSNDD